MKTKYYYTVMVIVYLVTILLMILINEILVTVFLVFALFMYQVVWFANFYYHMNESKKTFEREMEYKLSKTMRYQDKTRSQFSSLAEILGSGFLLIDENETIREANLYFNETFKLDQVINEKYDILNIYKSLYNIIHEAFISEKDKRGQIHHENRYYDINSAPIFEGNQYYGCLVLVHDITQIQMAEMFQKQFTADVTHELKTPLSALKGISEVLIRDVDMSKTKRQEFHAMIYKEAKRLETILNDLLIIAKMDRLDYELSLDVMNVKTFFTEIIELLTPEAKAKKLSLTSDIEDANVEMDALKMQQVVLNLVKNAINYTDKGNITFKGTIEQDEYVIQVSDTGIGISEEEQEKIFKRFYRVDAARSRASGGSGLGLSIIKNVVKKHQGNIALSSEPGKGSTFTIRIPIRQN